MQNIKGISAYCISSLRIQRRCYTVISEAMDDKPVLYGDLVSPPVRFVMMTAALLDVKLDVRNIELFAGENKSVEFTKINPLQKVPALVVGEAKILDSHAAAIYLCQRVKEQRLYPNDPLLRGKINEFLFYNSGRLFPLDSEIISSYFAGVPVADTKIEEWYRALDYLELNLNKNDWLTGNEMYLCDICAMQTITSLRTLVPITERHRNVVRWLKNFENLSCFDINKRGIEKLKVFIEKFKQNN